MASTSSLMMTQASKPYYHYTRLLLVNFNGTGSGSNWSPTITQQRNSYSSSIRSRQSTFGALSNKNRLSIRYSNLLPSTSTVGCSTTTIDSIDQKLIDSHQPFLLLQCDDDQDAQRLLEQRFKKLPFTVDIINSSKAKTFNVPSASNDSNSDIIPSVTATLKRNYNYRLMPNMNRLLSNKNRLIRSSPSAPFLLIDGISSSSSSSSASLFTTRYYHTSTILTQAVPGGGGGNDSSTTSKTLDPIPPFTTISTPIQIPLTFNHGHFKLYFFDRYEAILHYWQPIDALYHNLISEILPNSKLPDRSDVRLIHKFRMVNQEDDSGATTGSDSPSSSDGPLGAGLPPISTQQYRLSPSMPFGYLFVALNPARIQLWGFIKDKNGNKKDPILFQFKLDKDTLKKVIDWSNQNSVGSSGVVGQNTLPSGGKKTQSFAQHELLFLEQEKHLLHTKFDPLQTQFNVLVAKAKSDAHRRFKMGGLFLLSAQLGFVGRLTWFEYSWDIMEPVTWMLTYAMMVGTFAYYIVTSEEYLIPMVERRMVVGKFWKLVKKEQFDVRQYRLLRDELTTIEKQLGTLRKENFK